MLFGCLKVRELVQNQVFVVIYVPSAPSKAPNIDLVTNIVEYIQFIRVGLYVMQMGQQTLV
jgi:hypothetical protein